MKNAGQYWEKGCSSVTAVKFVHEYSMKLADGELLALGAYQVSGRKAYVYIPYMESAPQSNPTITSKAQREYYGIGETMIAFGH